MEKNTPQSLINKYCFISGGKKNSISVFRKILQRSDIYKRSTGIKPLNDVKERWIHLLTSRAVSLWTGSLWVLADTHPEWRNGTHEEHYSNTWGWEIKCIFSGMVRDYKSKEINTFLQILTLTWQIKSFCKLFCFTMCIE